MRRINIGLIGAGVVGSALVSQLDLKYDRIKMEFDILMMILKKLQKAFLLLL